MAPNGSPRVLEGVWGGGAGVWGARLRPMCEYGRVPMKRDNDAARVLWRLSGIGIELIVLIVVFMVIGWLLDRWWGTSPWMMLSLAVLGVVGGLYKAAMEARAAGDKAQEKYRRDHPRN